MEEEVMDQNIINEIRSKVDIVDVVSSYLPLTQKGKNFFGVCPFHDDTNPSMSVSRELQIYRCFSCGASGNVFHFVMNYEHVSFKEALRILANRAGVEIKGLKLTETKNPLTPYYEIYDLANKFYQNNLSTTLGKKAKEYLSLRSVDEALIKEFEIGLSLKDTSTLTRLLEEKGYDAKTLRLLGLMSDHHDTYINRIMFPLWDLEGRPIGFSGRIYDDSNTNKYLNTKETPLFKKGQLLYHYHIAREEVRVKKQVVVMEGFMDVIRASSIGIKNTVALMGTAMTDEQAKLIARLSKEIVLCFDGDEAGIHANLVNGEHFQKMGIQVKVLPLSDDYDPDTFILKEGAEKFKNLLENAMHYNDYKIMRLKQTVNFHSEEEVATYINAVLQETVKLNDPIHEEITLKHLAKECDISYNTLEKRFQELKSASVTREEKVPILPKPKKTPTHKDKYSRATLAILYYLLVSDRMVQKYEREGILFPDENARFLASEILYFKRKYGIIKVADFYTYLTDKDNLSKLTSEVLSQELPEKITEQEMDDYFGVIREYNKNREIKRLQKMIKEEMDPMEKARLAEKIKGLRIGEC